MKRITLIALTALLLVSCAKQEDVMCSLTLTAQMPSGEKIVALNVDSQSGGNYFRNLNTGETYTIPRLVNGRANMTILKGVYVISFDGVAALSDGKGKKVRCAQYATLLTAVTLTEDTQNLELPLIVLQ